SSFSLAPLAELHAAREEHADHDEQEARGVVRASRPGTRPPGAFAEGLREPVLERREFGVDPRDILEDGLYPWAVRMSGGDLRVKLRRASLELGDQPIALAPQRDGAPHVAHLPEVPEQRRHSRDVVGMIAAAEEPLPDDVGVRLSLLEFEARLAV